MKKRLFEYVILQHPTNDEIKEGKTSKIIVEVTQVMAKDEKEAGIHASRAIPDANLDALDQVEVIVRPF